MFLKTFQSELTEWFVRHSDLSLKLVKDIATLRNKLTYATTMRVDSSIGDNATIKSSDVSSLILEEIYHNCNELNRIQIQMLANVGNMKKIVLSSRDDENDYDLDLDMLESIILQLEKQTFLEMSIHESLSNLGDFTKQLPFIAGNSNSIMIDNMNYVGTMSSLDSDCMTTMITCYVYSPYLKINDIKHIMNSKFE